MLRFFKSKEPLSQLEDFVNISMVESFLSKEVDSINIFLNKLEAMLKDDPNVYVGDIRFKQTILHGICQMFPVKFSPEKFAVTSRAIILRLIHSGIDLDKVDAFNQTAVMYLINRGEDANEAGSILILMNHMHSLQAADGQGNTILHLLAKNKFIAQLNLMLNIILKANFIFTANKVGKSALIEAKDNHNIHFLKTLIMINFKNDYNLEIPNEIYQLIIGIELEEYKMNLELIFICLKFGALIENFRSLPKEYMSFKNPSLLLELILNQYSKHLNQVALTFANEYVKDLIKLNPEWILDYADLLERISPHLAYQKLDTVSKYKSNMDEVTKFIIDKFESSSCGCTRKVYLEDAKGIINEREVAKIIIKNMKVDNRSLYYKAKLKQANIIYTNHLVEEECSSQSVMLNLIPIKKYLHVFKLLSKIKRKENMPELEDVYIEADKLRSKVIEGALGLKLCQTSDLGNLESKSQNFFYLACELTHLKISKENPNSKNELTTFNHIRKI